MNQQLFVAGYQPFYGIFILSNYQGFPVPLSIHLIPTFVHLSFSVLNDPSKSAIYDVYGEKGLEAEWEVVPRTRTAQDIREEYERLSKEQEERRIQQSTNPRVRWCQFGSFRIIKTLKYGFHNRLHRFDPPWTHYHPLDPLSLPTF